MKNDVMFQITKSTRIFLYGAASSGKVFAAKLEEMGMKIEAFVDKRASELETYMGLPVISIEQLQKKNLRDNYVVIISVKNVFEHTKIAKQLSKLDIKRVLYKPYSILNGGGSENEKKIDSAYQQVLDKVIDKLNGIPEIVSIQENLWNSSAVIAQNEHDVVVLLPEELIFTNYSGNQDIVWANLNVVSMFPHIKLFSFLDGKGGSTESYVSFCQEAAKATGTVQITEAWQRNVLRNRVDVYHNMNKYFEMDRDFFVRNASEAEWNSKGYFNLTGGKHRVTFQMAKGLRTIPIKLSISDYKRLMEEEHLKMFKQKIEQYLEQNSVLPGYIEHPVLAKYPFPNESFDRNITHAVVLELSEIIFKEIANISFSDFIVIDLWKDGGLMGRDFQRMGAQVYILEQDSDRILKQEIAEFLNQKVIMMKEEIDKEIEKKRVILLCEEEQKLEDISISPDYIVYIKNRGSKLEFPYKMNNWKLLASGIKDLVEKEVFLGSL